MRKFERSWMLADYWGLAVLPPSELSATASELDHMNSAAALEKIGRTEEAMTSYQKIIERWPQSLSALLGLANLQYSKKNYRRATEYLTQATRLHPRSAAAWHNRALAEKAGRQNKRARKSAMIALDLASDPVKKSYQENLSPIFEN